MDLGRAQRRRRVGREERVAGAGGEDHDAALLEVAHRAAADVGLGDLGDRRSPTARAVGALPSRARPAAAARSAASRACPCSRRSRGPSRRPRRDAAEDVAGADDDRDLDAARVHARDLLRRSPGPLAGRRRTRAGAHAAPRPTASSRIRRKAGAAPSAPGARPTRPTANRVKRRITTFSPVLAASSARSSSIVLAVVLVAVDVRLLEQDDLLEPGVELAL